MRSAGFLATAAGLLVLTTGCGPGYYCDPYYDPYCGYGVPTDYGGTGIDPWGYCSDPVSCGCTDPTVCLSEAPSLAGTSTPDAAACAPNDATCEVRTIGTSVNQALQSVLVPIDALLSVHSPSSGDVAVFGPIDSGPPGSHGAQAATFRLSTRRSSGRVAWKLEAKPLGSTSGWVEVFTGSMVPGAEPRRGRGVMGIDLDAMATVNPTMYAGGGKLLGTFASDDFQKATAYRLVGFHESSSPPINGLIASSTGAAGDVQTTLSLPSALPIQTSATATPLSSKVSPSSAATAPPDPGKPPEAMPDPGF